MFVAENNVNQLKHCIKIQINNYMNSYRFEILQIICGAIKKKNLRQKERHDIYILSKK